MKPEAYIFGAGAGGLNCFIAYRKHYSILGFVDNCKSVKARWRVLPSVVSPLELTPCVISGKVFILSSMETFIIIDQLVGLADGCEFSTLFPSPEIIYSPVGRLFVDFLIKR